MVARMLQNRLLVGILAIAVAFFGAAGASLGVQHARAAAVAAAPSSPVWSGSALAHMNEPGAWNCDQSRPWLMSARWGEGSGNLGSLGSSLPETPDDPLTPFNEARNYVVTMVANYPGRYYRVTFYSNLFGDLVVVYPFDSVQPEPGYSYPTNRLDPLGNPQPWMSGRSLRFSTGLWGGGNGQADFGGRAYMWCKINP